MPLILRTILLLNFFQISHCLGVETKTGYFSSKVLSVHQEISHLQLLSYKLDDCKKLKLKQKKFYSNHLSEFLNLSFFSTFQLKTYNTYYLITLLTNYYTLLLQQYHLERKLRLPHGTNNRKHEHNTTRYDLKTKIAQELHVTDNT